MLKLEVLKRLAEIGDMSKYGRGESIDYLIGYGCGKCLCAENIAKLIDCAATVVNMNDSEAVLDWIIKVESD